MILLMAEILHQLIGSFPIIYRVSAPSQVVVWDFSHQQYDNFLGGVFLLRCRKPTDFESYTQECAHVHLDTRWALDPVINGVITRNHPTYRSYFTPFISGFPGPTLI